MNNGAASDAGVGRAVFTTRFQLSMQAAIMCFWVGVVPGIVFPFLFWFVATPAQDLDIVRTSIVAALSDPEHHSKWQIRDSKGEYKFVEAVTDDGKTSRLLKPAEIRQALKSRWTPVSTFIAVVWVSFFLPFFLAWAVWFALVRLGARNLEDKRIRGAESFVSSLELDSLVRSKDKGGYKLVKVTLPAVAPMSGILMQGAQGSGKSLAIHDLMQQAFAKKRKSIIYDQSGEFYRAYFRPGKDFFFNPACIGSVPWSIFSELKYIYDADSLAQAFLPPKGGVVHGASAFFEDAARALFSVMLLRLAKHGAINTRDIATAIFEMPEDEMTHLIEKSVASSAVGGDSKGQRQGVISSIAIYLNGIKAVQEGSWSIRDFLEADDDARFFILGTDDTRAMFAPLYRLLLASSFAMIAAKQQIVHEDRYWYFLDEVHTLGDIKLDEQLATLRKFGVCIVSGIQSESQFSSSMGKDRAETLMNCFNTVLMLRMNEPTMMERAARRLGKVEMKTVSQNQALAVTEWRDGAGMSKADHEKWLVMPSEIGGLHNCSGYLKIVGGYPAAKVDYSDWLPSKPGENCYANQFAAKQDSPPRDPGFVIHRDWEAGSVDPLQKVSQALKDSKTNKAGDAEDETVGAKTNLEDQKIETDGELSIEEMIQNAKQKVHEPVIANDLIRGAD